MNFYGSDPNNFSALVYTGGNTWTGNDPNPKFDADDELVFMARDAGVQAPTGLATRWARRRAPACRCG